MVVSFLSYEKLGGKRNKMYFLPTVFSHCSNYHLVLLGCVKGPSGRLDDCRASAGQIGVEMGDQARRNENKKNDQYSS